MNALILFKNLIILLILVLNHIGNIVQTCIEEYLIVSPQLLDILLQPLLPIAKSDNPIAFKLMSRILRATTEIISNPISTLINTILIGTSTRSYEISSELSENIYSLLFELHKISPPLLIKIIPNLCLQLQIDEEDIRLKAVKLLGRLFSSQFADYGEDFARNYKEFTGRFVDLSLNIRIEMVETAAFIIRRKPSLRKLAEGKINRLISSLYNMLMIGDFLLEGMCQRLRDNEADVRIKSLQNLIEIGMEDCLLLSVDTYNEIIARFVDRKLEIKKMAWFGLAKIYNRHVSSTLPPITFLTANNLNDDYRSIEKIVDSEIWLRLKNIPGNILKCWGFPELQFRHQVIQVSIF